MASEDIYAGLSAGAKYAVGLIDSKRKADLEKELLQKRMEMQERFDEARAARAEAREAKKVAKDTIAQDANGNYVKRSFNSFGDALKEEPLGQYELDQINNSKRKDELSLESLSARASADKFKAANLEADRAMDMEDRSLDRRAKNASIESSLASAAASRARANKLDNEEEAPAPGIGDAANELAKDYQNLWKGYTSGDDPELSTQEVYNVAASSIKAAGMRGKDVGDTFRRALQDYVKNKNGQNKTTTKGFSLDNGN